jgi:HK97 family phage prohead protease
MKQVQLVCEASLNLPEKKSEEQTGKIEARVTTWGAREGADGRKFYYRPEGFAAWAQEFQKMGKPLPMFLNHNSDSMPVGEWTNFEFDDEGMNASGRLFVNTTSGSDLYQIMTESPNMFGGVSVGAYADEYQMVKENGDPCDDDDGFFQITNGGLREVSVVMYPNNPLAEVKKLEFFRPDGSADLKVLESALREAGLSRKDAVTAASTFRQVLEQRDAVKDEPTAPQQSESDAEVTAETEILKALEERELLRVLSQKLKG